MPKAIISGAGGVLTEVEIEEQAEPVEYRPLEPYQFHAMLKIAELTDQVNAAVAAIEDPEERAVAEVRLERSQQFRRNDPLLQDLVAAVGLTSEALNKMWLKAAKF